jgi:hypothetical protein
MYEKYGKNVIKILNDVLKIRKYCVIKYVTWLKIGINVLKYVITVWTKHGTNVLKIHNIYLIRNNVLKIVKFVCHQFF